jgi:hypothetical protein
VKTPVAYGNGKGTVTPPASGAETSGHTGSLLQRLSDASDHLNPIIVKEVRQIVRGREFNYSFMVSLLVGLIIAFFGAANASSRSGTYGQAVFGALTGCLTLLGMVVVPLGAFHALRNERLEQTMDLITVTALSPRKVIVGKLLAQTVKLGTLFAGMAPFVAMSFLLGGIDFGTIAVSLALVFLGSLWVCAAALLLSTLARSRGASGALLIGGGLLVLLFLGGFRVVQMLLMVLFSAGGGGIAATGGGFAFGVGSSSLGGGPQNWWPVMLAATLGSASLANLVLLAENRLSSPVEDKATALRIGFFAQFLAIIGVFSAAWYVLPVPGRVTAAITVLCGLHLAIVAAFTIAEDFSVSRRVQLRMQAPSRWRLLDPILRPGGGRGALYVLAQMGLLLLAIWALTSDPADVRWAAAACGYICFFTGVPAAALRYLRPGISSFQIRIAILVVLSASLVLPDVLYYLMARSDGFSLTYSVRHLLNPLRTLANWNVVETRGWFEVPNVLASTGLLAYVALIHMSTANRRRPRHQAAAADATGD